MIMKRYLLFSILVFGSQTLLAEDDLFEPKVYADVSEKSQNESVSMGGTRILAGIKFGTDQYKTSMIHSAENKHSFSPVGLTLGAEYAAYTKSGMLWGVEMTADICSSKKKEGAWTDINAAYDSFKRTHHFIGNNIDHPVGQFETSAIIPNIAFKLGFPLKKYQSLLFGKVGLSIVKGTCRYYDQHNSVQHLAQYPPDGREPIDIVSASIIVPFVAFGAERKFNKTWGAIIEMSFSLNRAKSSRVSARQDLYTIYSDHKISAQRIVFRAMASYTVMSDSSHRRRKKKR